MSASRHLTDVDSLRMSALRPEADSSIDWAAGIEEIRQSPDRQHIDGGLCLPQIKPEHIGDAVRPRSDGTECVLLPRRHVISARPCSTISECACHYSSPYTIAAHGADGVRRTPLLCIVGRQPRMASYIMVRLPSTTK